MNDSSTLDHKYFVDDTTYNCPFCNRRNVVYEIKYTFHFDWSADKQCFGTITECSSCENRAVHFSYEDITSYNGGYYFHRGKKDKLDDLIFHSIPSSFFVQDSRIPRLLRELIKEAEGSLKMNFLTGASACVRKAIYELLVEESATGDDYETKIKSLKSKFNHLDPIYFDILSHIQGMTSEKVHEQSWDKWDSNNLKLLLETLKKAFYEIYVIPKERNKNAEKIRQLKKQLENHKSSQKDSQNTDNSSEAEEKTGANNRAANAE